MNIKDEVIDFVKLYDIEFVEDIWIVIIVFNDYFDILLFGIINIFRYIFEIKMMSGKIMVFFVKYDNVIFNIILVEIKVNDIDVWIKKDDYELYYSVDDVFYSGFVCFEYMLIYNKIIMDIEF